MISPPSSRTSSPPIWTAIFCAVAAAPAAPSVQHPADRLTEASLIPGGIVRYRLEFTDASLLLRVQTGHRRDLRGEVREPPDLPMPVPSPLNRATCALATDTLPAASRIFVLLSLVACGPSGMMAPVPGASRHDGDGEIVEDGEWQDRQKRPARLRS
jgi:hypothetical protein